jgi:FkbM family methyltransferase
MMAGMQCQSFDFAGRRFDLFLHADPDHLARVVKATRSFYENDVLMKCREAYIPGTTILDVGANVGNHTLFFAGVIGAPVIAFEPHPPSFDLLGMNVHVNEVADRVRLHLSAVGAGAGMADLVAGPASNRGMNRCAFGAGDTPVIALDQADIAGPVGLVKIDVEGAEPAVLAGATGLLRAWMPDLMIEAADAAAFTAVATPLLDLGYVPRGRFAATPTYWFSAVDQAARMRRLLGR